MITCKQNKDMIIEKLLRKLIAFVVVMAFMIPLIAPQVFAASSVNISGGDNVKGGDKFTVSVVFDGGNIGRVDAYMNYDTDKLTYISGGSSTGNTGYIQLKKAGTDGSIVFNLQFQAVSSGNTAIEVITNEMYDFDEVALDRPSGSKTISISGDAPSGALVEQTTSPDEPVEATELIGVDEATDGSLGTAGYALIIAIAVVIIILIVVIIMVLKKKKKPSEPHKPVNNQTQQDFAEEPRIGRSGRPLEASHSRRRDHSSTVRRQASEETEVWDDWHLEEKSEFDDIEKW